MFYISMKFLLVCVLAVCVQFGESVEETCSQTGSELTTFTSNAVPMVLPCKYHAASVKCQGYKIQVTPGLANADSELYVDSLWISVKKDDYYWKGRTSLAKLMKNLDGSGQNPFATKDHNLDTAPFEVDFRAELSATLTISDSQATVRYFARMDQLNSTGWEISCPEADFTQKSVYPRSICGDEDQAALTSRMSELGLSSLEATVVYDILDNDDIKQMNPQCQVATDVFHSCSADRTQVINECVHLLTDQATRSCLETSPFGSMDAFNLCLRHQCSGDFNSCHLLTALQQICPSVNVVDSPCGNCTETFTATQGVLQSMNYPDYYINYLDCYFLIVVPENHVVSLTIPSLEIESGSTCNYDWLRVYDGHNTDAPLLGDYCGSHSNLILTSSGPFMYLYFHTDYSVLRTGFQAQYTAVGV